MHFCVGAKIVADKTRYDNVTLSPLLLPARVKNRSHSTYGSKLKFLFREYFNFFLHIMQGRIQDFKLGGGGAHLKKLRRAEGGANIFGVFRVKNHDFTPKKSYFSPGSAPVMVITYYSLQFLSNGDTK